MIDINLLLKWGAVYKKVTADQIIFSEDEPCFFYNQLVSGKVRWVNIDDKGREYIHSIVEPGESFGELPLFDGGNYAATAIANEDSVIIKLRKDQFQELLKENQGIYSVFTALLAKRLRFKFMVLKSFGASCPETRITTLLHHLKSENKNFCCDCGKLTLTRQQIADMTGLRVETVIRTIRTMHEKGELLISKGKVFCKDV